MSNSADSPEGPARRTSAWAVRGLTAAVFALAGLIFVTSANTAKGTNLRSDSSLLKLSDLIRERSEKNGELNDSVAGARADIDALAQRDDGSTKAEDARLKALEKAAGTTKITGDSVSVTLDDAPPTPPPTPATPSPSPTTWSSTSRTCRPW